MPLSPKLSAAQLDTHFAEIAPRYSEQQAIVESDRCLFCFDAPCISACPTGIDVPSFIKKIATRNVIGAARTILRANILGASCARVCPTEVLCEGACVLLDRDRDPIKIGRLQRYATDFAAEKKMPLLAVPEKRSGKRVAIIGGGPAGLGCAAELAQLGHQAVIFERKPHAGGLNTYGIAYYKMKPVVSLQEVALVRSLGVEFRCGTEVGRDISRAELERDFDGIFLGVGLGGGHRLGISGEDLPEVVDALAFIEEIHRAPLAEIAVGARAAVIGCGNTAIDAATQARRLGVGEVVIVYRRSEAEMSAYAFEYDLAKRDGVNFLFEHAPLAVLEQDGHVAGLRLAVVRAGGQNLETIPGSEFTEPFDMIIKAVGQEKQAPWLGKIFPELQLNRDGSVTRDFQTGRTNLPHVFAGGDCANGGREVVNAVAEGKKAARGLHEMFSQKQIVGPVQPSRWGALGGPSGAGFDAPIRVAELEAAYEKLSPVAHPSPATNAFSARVQQ